MSGFGGATAVRQTDDGGYILLMSTSFGALVLKLTAAGDVVWQRYYGDVGLERSASPSSVELTADNGLIVVGTTNTETHFLAAWLLRLDANGNTVWQRSYGGIDGNDNGRAVLPTRDGGYVLAGRTDSFGAGDGDAWLLGLDANGNVICQRSYGGTDIDVFESLTLTDDGGYVVAGGTRSFGAGGFYVWVLKVNAVGDISNCNIIATSNVAPVDIVGNLGDRFATARATSADTKRRGGHRSVDRSDR